MMKSMIGSGIHRAEETERRRMGWGFEDGFLKRTDKKDNKERYGWIHVRVCKGGGRLGRYRQAESEGPFTYEVHTEVGGGSKADNSTDRLCE